MKDLDLTLIVQYFSEKYKYNERSFREVVRWRAELFNLIYSVGSMPKGVRRAVLTAFDRELEGMKKE